MEVHNSEGQTAERELKVRSGSSSKATYKSYKKKYRKFRIKFDADMALNQQQYREEQRALETARRLAIENDQLLDMLHDVNSCPAITTALRYDITAEDSNITALPQIIPSLGDIVHPSGPEGDALYEEVVALVKKSMDRKQAAIESSHSFSKLLDTFQPKSLESLPDDQQADLKLDHPIAYLTPDQIDEATSLMDMIMGPESAPTPQSSVAVPNKPTDKELEVQNPHSVYSWLRTNEPQVFLQDGEEMSGSGSGKTGSLRGAGKRASLAHSANIKSENPSSVGHDGLEEDVDSEGGVLLVSIPVGVKGAKGGKRKRNVEDDVGYKPRGGGGRPAKKKRGDGSISRRSSAGVPKSKGTKAERSGEVLLDMGD